MEKSKLIQALDEIKPMRRASLNVPVQHIFQKWSVQKWLLNAVEEAINYNHPLVAIGLIDRLWIPETSAEREMLIKQKLNGVADVDVRFMEVLNSVPTEELQTEEAITVERVHLLIEELQDEWDDDCAEAYLLTRDDFESIRCALQQRELGLQLKEVLAELDDLIASHNVCLTEYNPRLYGAWSLDPDVPYSCH